MRNQFGEQLFSIFFKTYTEKVWGMSCDEISADWAAQRIKGLDLGVAVIERAEARRCCRKRAPKAGGPVVKTLIESFQYPRKGPGMMWEAAARKIQERGGKILMGRELAEPALRRRRQALDASRSPRRTAARETYTAQPCDLLGAGARAGREDRADADLACCMRATLRYRDFLTVALMVEEARPVPRQLDLHPRSVGEGRPRAELPLVVARDGAGPGMSCLGLEYFCFEGDGLWTRPTTT